MYEWICSYGKVQDSFEFHKSPVNLNGYTLYACDALYVKTTIHGGWLGLQLNNTLVKHEANFDSFHKELLILGVTGRCLATIHTQAVGLQSQGGRQVGSIGLYYSPSLGEMYSQLITVLSLQYFQYRPRGGQLWTE